MKEQIIVGSNDPRVDVLDKHKVARPRMYSVIMLNDDYTPMDFVVFVLKKVFHKEQTEAEQIMMDIHKTGRGLAGVFTLEIAECKVIDTLHLAKLEQHPLQVSVEPV